MVARLATRLVLALAAACGRDLPASVVQGWMDDSPDVGRRPALAIEWSPPGR